MSGTLNDKVCAGTTNFTESIRAHAQVDFLRLVTLEKENQNNKEG